MSNTDKGVLGIVARLQPLSPGMIVVEATGELEALVVTAFAPAGLPVVAVNPRQIRDFAKPLADWPKPIKSMPTS